MPGGPRNPMAFTVVVAVVTAVCAVLMAVVIVASGRPNVLLLATALAFAPVVPLVASFLWLDRYEPEPRHLLVSALAWGAFAATGLALVLQVLLAGIGFSPTQILVVGAPVTEEATKGLLLCLLLWWRRHELDGILDGFVYAGLVGVGFAFTENILYLSGAYTQATSVDISGAQALTGTFILRCLVSPFAHPLFTAFIGVGVGLAVSTRSGTVRLLAPVGGYLLAVLTHALWNAAAVADSFLLMYVGLGVPAMGVMGGFALWSRSSERRLLALALGDAAHRGLLPASDIGWLTDLGARRRMRRHVRESSGPAGLAALRDYQQAAIELGFLHHRYLRGTAPADFDIRGRHHVARINAARPYFSFPGQVVPTR